MDQFGEGMVQVVKDSNHVDKTKLDPNKVSDVTGIYFTL